VFFVWFGINVAIYKGVGQKPAGTSSGGISKRRWRKIMKKIMMIAALVGLGLGFAKASTNSFIGRTFPGTVKLQRKVTL